MVMELSWNSSIASEEKPIGESLLIKGVLVDASTNVNKWAIDEHELATIAKAVPGAQLRADHGKSIFDIIGGLTKGEYDAQNKRVLFEAEVDNPEVIRSILKKRVKYISIGAQADSFCSVCGKSTRPIKQCKCEGAHEIIRNVKLREASIICEPAYEHSEFTPVSFISSIERALAQEFKEENKKEEKKEMSEEVKPKKEETKQEEDEAVKVKVKKDETQLKPAGPDSVVVLGEMMKKMEEGFKKMEEALGKGIPKDIPKKEDEEEEDEAKKKEDEDEAKKKEALKEEVRRIVKEELLKVKKEEDEAKKKESEEEEEEEESKKKEEDEEEEEEAPKKKEVKGAKVDTSQDIEASSKTVTGDLSQEMWKEIKAAAKKFDIIQ
jgi:hypothetical protein